MTNPLETVDLVAKVLTLVDQQPLGVIFSTKQITQLLGTPSNDLLSTSKRVGRALAQLGLLKRRNRGGTFWIKPATWAVRTNQLEVAKQESRAALAKRAVEGVEIHSAADLRKLTSSVIPPTFETLFALAMNPGAKHSDVIAAIQILHDRILGKSTQAIAIEVRNVKELSTAELEQLLAIDAEYTELPTTNNTVEMPLA